MHVQSAESHCWSGYGLPGHKQGVAVASCPSGTIEDQLCAGRIYERYLKPVSACANCGEALGHIRTDDFAPWLTILVLGHILVPLLGTIDYFFTPPLWLIVLSAVASGAILALAVLPHAKGLCLGMMWALGLKGDEQH